MIEGGERDVYLEKSFRKKGAGIIHPAVEHMLAKGKEEGGHEAG